MYAGRWAGFHLHHGAVRQSSTGKWLLGGPALSTQQDFSTGRRLLAHTMPELALWSFWRSATPAKERGGLCLGICGQGLALSQNRDLLKFCTPLDMCCKCRHQIQSLQSCPCLLLSPCPLHCFTAGLVARLTKYHGYSGRHTTLISRCHLPFPFSLIIVPLPLILALKFSNGAMPGKAVRYSTTRLLPILYVLSRH